MDEIAEKLELSTFQEFFTKQKAKSSDLRAETVGERKARLRSLRNWIMSNRPRLQEAVFRDFGKPAQEVETSEVFPVIGEINYALESLSDWVRPKKVDAPLTYIGTRAEIRYEPKGVCLIIAPWNYPFNLCIGPLVSCLAAGNTAIVKPSELTPNTSALIKTMAEELFSGDVVKVIEGDAIVSSALLRLPFDHIFFTGSPAVGKIVMKAAAENLTSVTLELGGKSPAIVDATANLSDAAKRLAFGKFLNKGQTCIAPDYLLIEESVKEKFIGLLKREISALFGRKGKVTEESADYGRIVNAKHFQRIHQLVQDAIQRGSKVEFSGEANEKSLFFPPTILTEVPPDAQIMDEEIFGPVLPVVTFSKKERAIEIINNKPKPLGLYLFSNDSQFRKKVMNETSSGAVCINDCILQFTHTNVPFGGVNNSGIGKAHGYHGFLAFSNEKPVIRQRKGFANAYLFHPPYTPLKKKLLDLVIRWFA